MDSTIEQTKNRASRIFAVETALRKINTSNKMLDYEAFVIEICEMFNCSDRTAREYIKIAKSRIKDWLTVEHK